MSTLAALAFGPILLAAATSSGPAAPDTRPLPSLVPNIIIDCYVVQSSSIGLGQFVRHLQIDGARRTVSVSDGLRGGAPRFLGDGRLVALDSDHIVFDFATANSAGRTEIDRRTGAFRYNDGRTLVRGSCREGS